MVFSQLRSEIEAGRYDEDFGEQPLESIWLPFSQDALIYDAKCKLLKLAAPICLKSQLWMLRAVLWTVSLLSYARPCQSHRAILLRNVTVLGWVCEQRNPLLVSLTCWDRPHGKALKSGCMLWLWGKGPPVRTAVSWQTRVQCHQMSACLCRIHQ